MAYLIAVAGKGGTGKTTVSALLVRLLVEADKGLVLAIDADPNSNLGLALGIKTEKSISSILERISSQPEAIPKGMAKDSFVQYEIQMAIAEEEGFDLLTMGAPEGPGCYCYVNNVLRQAISKLVNDYDFVVVDNEAGLEHFSRRTTRKADTLLVVSDPTVVGLRSAQRIKDLVEELKIPVKNKILLLNRVKGGVDKLNINQTGLDYVGFLPWDEALLKISENGQSLFELSNNSQIISKLRELGDRIWSN